MDTWSRVACLKGQTPRTVSGVDFEIVAVTPTVIDVRVSTGNIRPIRSPIFEAVVALGLRGEESRPSVMEQRLNLGVALGGFSSYIAGILRALEPSAFPHGEENKPMFCLNCGLQLPVGANFCDECGSKQRSPDERANAPRRSA
jgi:hypothetical protein